MKCVEQLPSELLQYVRSWCTPTDDAPYVLALLKKGISLDFNMCIFFEFLEFLMIPESGYYVIPQLCVRYYVVRPWYVYWAIRSKWQCCFVVTFSKFCSSVNVSGLWSVKSVHYNCHWPLRCCWTISPKALLEASTMTKSFLLLLAQPLNSTTEPSGYRALWSFVIVYIAIL